MNNNVKLVLYVVLVSLAAWLGHQFYATYSAITKASIAKAALGSADSGEPVAKPVKHAAGANSPGQATNTAPESLTNAPGAAAAAKNLAGESGSTTNATPTGTNDETTSVATNATTNTAPNLASNTNEPVGQTNQEATLSAATEPVPAATPIPQSSTMVGYLGAFVGSMILLGLLIAHDASQFFGNRSVDFIFNDKGEGMRAPEYEEAEQTWANGDHLEAIQMMREYLRKNPREQYVALRIAEIYEKDLRNYLAATLEYEEILKHRIEPERWGWAAIHLCNLYSKTGKMDKTVELLRRIEAEYGGTAAAEKARKRLALYDASGTDGLQPEEQGNSEAS